MGQKYIQNNRKFAQKIGFLIGIIFLIILNVHAKSDKREVIQPYLVTTPIKIDGNLDDEVWKNPPIDKTFITYNPRPGNVLPQKTVVWVAYDSQNLYFAFKCYDTEPDKIKTSITKRDNLFSDDWVGIRLDAMGNGQSAYDLFVNPSGMQGDIYTTVNNGEDGSPDWVWQSAGKITDQGYQVELKLPLKSIRFKSGKEVKMGLLFWRRISRLGVSGSWPEIKPGVGSFNILAITTFKGLKSVRKLEALPSITYSSGRDKDDASTWGAFDNETEFGIDLKWGITSSIITDLTINPDFSQVESDAFFVNVNRRYPIFFSEKRPFFMESKGIFNIAGTGGDMNMYTAVHTRRIIDPSWGVKLTGTVGKTTFGVLTARDVAPGRPWEDELNPHQGKGAIFSIARGKTSLGGDNYLGLLYTRRDFAGGFNQVIGSDLKFRLGRSHSTSLTFLNSSTREADASESQSSNMAVVTYNYSSKSLGIFATFEHFGKDFQMAPSFMLRNGINKGMLYVGPLFAPKSKKLSWIKQVNPFIFGYVIHDLHTGMDDMLFLVAVRLNFSKQGTFRIDYIWFNESWVDETFKQGIFRMMGRVQLTKWLRLGGNIALGDGIYYDEENPYMGRNNSYGFDLTFQPDSKFRESLAIDYWDFKDPQAGTQVYDALIVNSRTTYQFNKYFFIRANLRYDSYSKNFLTDLLASFTLIPGTVVHFGYGSLYDHRDWQIDGRPIRPNRLFLTRQSFFFKASYRWRL